RLELSPNKRATCKVTHCQKEGIKIEKGELRFGTLVTINENTSWTYKHWGCITPQVLQNVSSYLDGDFELLQGFDVLPEDFQEKVTEAISLGHVDDGDWRGDVEMNRPGAGQGMFLNKAAKKRLG
ncbi:poly polymerase and DNA-ligase Zn-finger region-domain-containing protein, partial [Phyllosticta citrichinensis]